MKKRNRPCACGSGKKLRSCCGRSPRVDGATTSTAARTNDSICAVCIETASTFSGFVRDVDYEGDAFTTACDAPETCKLALVSSRLGPRHVVHFRCIDGVTCASETRREGFQALKVSA